MSEYNLRVGGPLGKSQAQGPSMICGGIKRNGQPCGFKCRKDAKFCGHHQPRVTEAPRADTFQVSCDILSTRKIPESIYWEALRLLEFYKIELSLMAANKQAVGYWSFSNGRHQIRIADDLYGVDFVETFIHEVAHATTWNLYKNTVKPHGIEWKTEYRQLMELVLKFHRWTLSDRETLSKPGATKRNTLHDMKEKDPGSTFVCELEVNQKFTYKGKLFTVTSKGRGKNVYCSNGDNQPWKFGIFTPIEI